MRSHREARRVLAAPALGLMLSLVLAATITACSGSGPAASPPTTATPAAPGSAPGAGAPSAAVATIKANWVKFFAGTTPAAERVSLLQNGRAFAKTIGAMSVLGTSASARVSAVRLTSPRRAAVTYTVYLGKTAVLPDEKGVAVLENGIWRVSDESFCVLLTLQNGGKTPSVCSSAG